MWSRIKSADPASERFRLSVVKETTKNLLQILRRSFFESSKKDLRLRGGSAEEVLSRGGGAVEGGSCWGPGLGGWVGEGERERKMGVAGRKRERRGGRGGREGERSWDVSWGPLRLSKKHHKRNGF